MTYPDWFGGDGSRLLTGHDAFTDLADIVGVVVPTAGAVVPTAVQQTMSGPSGESTWIGTAALWGSEDARFGLSANGRAVPTRMWVAKPMVFASEIALPGVSTGTLWMILMSEVPKPPADLEGPQPLALLRRHVVGLATIADRRLLLRLDLIGDLVIGEFDLAAPTSGNGGADALTDIEHALLGDLGELHALEFGHLASLFGNDHDPDADLVWLPEHLRNAELFSLDAVTFRVDPNDSHNLVGIGARVEFAGGASWPLIPGFEFLTVGQLKASFEVDHPLEGAARRLQLGVSGAITLGAESPATIEVSARFPDLAIEGHLVDGDDNPIILPDLLEALHLPRFGDGPRITSLAFSARPAGLHKSFSISFRAGDLLSIPIGPEGGGTLDVKELDASLDLSRSTAGSEGGAADGGRSLTARIEGQLELGAVDLALRASSDHGGEGWTIEAWLVDPLNLSELETWIEERFGAHKLPSHMVAAELDDLKVSYHTSSGDVSFEIGTVFDLFGSTAGHLELQMALAHHGEGHYERRIAGRFTIGTDHYFDLVVAQDADTDSSGQPTTSQVLIGAYRQDGETTVGDLLEAVDIPLAIPVVVADALVAHSEGHTLCLVDMRSAFDLTKLPFVGPMLPADEKLGLVLRVIAASGEWDADHVGAVNDVLPDGYEPLKLPDGVEQLPVAELAVSLTLGSETLHLDTLGAELKPTVSEPSPATPTATAEPAIEPVTEPAGGPNPAPQAATPVQAKDGAPPSPHWVPLQKDFGPIHARRIGVLFEPSAQTIEVLFDADVRLGRLTLSLDGLGVKNPLDRFEPTFSLRGLGLDLRTPSFEIGGTFLLIDPHNFAGAAMLSTPTLTLSAIGAYGEVDGHASLFVYAVLDYPLGGPSFFFVTGLAAGFGYNRKLIMPSLNGVAEFPLVKEAVAGSGNAALPTADGLTAKLDALATYVPPSNGDMFFVLGVKFTSFKLIDSFVLAAVSVGSQVVIDVVGVSTLVAPTPTGAKPATPIAEIQIAIKARIVPAEGTVAVDAALTPASFLVSRDCHLTGGAAFYAWFSGPHAGDFVATIGGYHPDFTPPSHYPTVPRLSLQWQVSSELSVKGTMYFALTGSAIMAGGSLDANYASGAIAAWFRAGIDFLMVWQPYRYEASAYVNVGATWHSIGGEVGASVRVWGPDFAGEAEVHLPLAPFTVTFGSSKRTKHEFLSWGQFTGRSLPPVDQICTIQCERGLLRQIDAGQGFSAEWVVGAHELVIQVGTQIPVTEATSGSTTIADLGGATTRIGVGPVDVAVGSLVSKLDVTVAGAGEAPLAMDWIPVLKAVPTALWGAPTSAPEVNGDRLLGGTLAGFRLRPSTVEVPNVLPPIARSDLSWNESGVTGLAANAPAAFVPGSSNPAEESAGALAARRSALLVNLGADPGAFRPGPGFNEMFVESPRLAGFVEA